MTGLNLSVFTTEYDTEHISTLTLFDSVLDLFTLCNLIFLFNVLDFRTYQTSAQGGKSEMRLHDLNDVPTQERYQMAHARGCCFDILHWFFTKYEIFDKETEDPIDGFKEVAMEYLCHQASVILAYKKISTAMQLEDDTLSGGLNYDDLEVQIKLCFRNHKEIPPIKSLEDTSMKKPLSLALPRKGAYGVRKLERSLPHERKHFLRHRVLW
jgi:hypothetical protein